MTLIPVIEANGILIESDSGVLFTEPPRPVNILISLSSPDGSHDFAKQFDAAGARQIATWLVEAADALESGEPFVFVASLDRSDRADVAVHHTTPDDAATLWPAR